MNLIKSIIQTPSIEFQNKITLFANHLLFVFAFFSPIYNRATSSIVFVLIILLVLRKNYIYYFNEAFSNKVVQAILLF
ncbi:polymerase, partial [Aliarcobacter cryaerophilus]